MSKTVFICIVSGLARILIRINLAAFFSHNVPARTKALIKRCLGMKEFDKRTKHLGLSMVVERNKSLVF